MEGRPVSTGPISPTNTTQARHPWRATLRTAVATILSLAPVVAALEDQLHLSKTWPWFAAVVAGAAFVTRVLADPTVERWLRKRKLTSWIAAASGK
jgi:hypothetical protein